MSEQTPSLPDPPVTHTYLHPEHEIRHLRNLDADTLLEEYEYNYRRCLALGNTHHAKWYFVAYARRKLSLWEEARDFFLATLRGEIRVRKEDYT